MLNITTADLGSKRLEYLLTQIAAVKDQSAFAELYSATKGKLLSTVRMIVKRRDIAEEIHDVYVRIWSNAGPYLASSGLPMTWMIAIARNLAIDGVSGPGLEVYSDDSVLLELPNDRRTAAELLEAAEADRGSMERQQKVLSALQLLNPVRGDLVIAAYIRGESRQQLSKRTGVPVNTVKTWIRRALLEVKAILQNSGEDKNIVFRQWHHRGDFRITVHR